MEHNKRSPNSEFPEGRPLDQYGVPVPTRLHVEQQRILAERIERQKVMDKIGGPVAGHDFARERSRDRGRR